MTRWKLTTWFTSVAAAAALTACGPVASVAGSDPTEPPAVETEPTEPPVTEPEPVEHPDCNTASPTPVPC
jgi:hypothetical protein